MPLAASCNDAEAAQQAAQVDSPQSSGRNGEKEPEPVTQADALDGVAVSAGLTSVIQHTHRSAAQPSDRNVRANYRGDVTVTLPGGEMGKIDGRIFLHARFGQGEGVGLRPTHTGSPNSTAFPAGDTAAGKTHFMVAQAWYELTVPLPLDGVKTQSHNAISLTVGKIDPFVFFDQNAIADDETERFLDNVFVHNPLLDSGGDVGADAYGFSPGVVLRYANTYDKSAPWRVALGIFGSGEGVRFSASPGKHFVIAQADMVRHFDGLPGTYRAYVWSNGRASDFDGTEARHSGLGVSIDQHVTDSLVVFGRYGHQLTGKVRFDQALTLGAEWQRGSDALGVAAGLLRTAGAFRAESQTVDADADGLPDFGYAASGWERVAEVYYRMRLNDYVALTPDLQFIQRPGGDGTASVLTLFGLRVRVGF